MPIEKKKGLRTGPPTHRQEMSLASIDRTFGDLVSTLTLISGNDPEMRQIINTLRGPITQAKQWVLKS